MASRNELAMLSSRLAATLTGKKRSTDRYRRLHWMLACVMWQMQLTYVEPGEQTAPELPF